MSAAASHPTTVRQTMALGAGEAAPRLPGSVLLASHLRQWQRDPVTLVTEAARLGRVVRLDLPGRTFLVTHPADVKHVLQDNHQNYCKGWVFDRIKPYWGDSLLTADGDTWRRQRQRRGRQCHGRRRGRGVVAAAAGGHCGCSRG